MKDPESPPPPPYASSVPFPDPTASNGSKASHADPHHDGKSLSRPYRVSTTGIPDNWMKDLSNLSGEELSVILKKANELVKDRELGTPCPDLLSYQALLTSRDRTRIHLSRCKKST